MPELASLGVTQLNEYEPNVAHTLNKVVSVERQVQVRFQVHLFAPYSFLSELNLFLINVKTLHESLNSVKKRKFGLKVFLFFR